MNVDCTFVRYFAVYPDGRRCEVGVYSAIQHAERWKREEGIEMLTRVERVAYPVLGKLLEERCSL